MAKSAEVEHHNKAFDWAATDTSGLLSPFNFSRRTSFSQKELSKLKIKLHNATPI